MSLSSLIPGISHDHQYLQFLKYILDHGEVKTDRTGTGTISVFDYTMRFDISRGIIPVLTTKKMHWQSLVHEIIWYLSGNTNIKYLMDNGVRIWKEWADENGDLGPVYGASWRRWPAQVIAIRDCDTSFETRSDGENWLVVNPDAQIETTTIDQIAEVIHTLKTNPDSRRMLVNCWNVGLLSKMQLPPCHYTFQFYSSNMSRDQRIHMYKVNNNISHDIWYPVSDEQLETIPTRSLSCKLTQRSADAFLGVPFNIAQYSMLTCIIAKLVGMVPKDFIWSGADCHIYSNHIDQVKEQLTRTPYPSPSFKVADTVDNIDNLQYNDFILQDYQFYPTIKATVAI